MLRKLLLLGAALLMVAPFAVNVYAEGLGLKNLRVLCPNCNATLPTHCGKNIPR